MSSEVALAFSELFYGAGAWLGVLLMETILWALALKTEWGGVIGIIVTVFMGIDAITSIAENSNLMWIGIIYFFTSAFLLFNFMKGKGK